jgi:hypothetical protein
MASTFKSYRDRLDNILDLLANKILIFVGGPRGPLGIMDIYPILSMVYKNATLLTICSMDVYLVELLGASAQLAICSKSPCSIAISS